jgi:hypothetical protein
MLVWTPKATSRSERFDIGAITALLEERGAYQVSALTGRIYIIPEREIRGKAGSIRSGRWQVD